MKHVGITAVPTGTCGFSDAPESPTCGKPAVMHAVIRGTWEGQSEASACSEHAPALVFVADEITTFEDSAS